MMATTQATGVTTNCEAVWSPVIVELAELLTGMGTKISGAGTLVIRVEGVTELRGVSYRLNDSLFAPHDGP